jgi:hypothetical protein
MVLMIKYFISRVIEILYTIRLSRRLEQFILQGYHPLEAIGMMRCGKIGNKFVTKQEAERAIGNLRRYVRPIPTPTT